MLNFLAWCVMITIAVSVGGLILNLVFYLTITLIGLIMALIAKLFNK